MFRIQALICDFDGVLVDGERFFKQLDETFLAEIAPGWNAEQQRGLWGMSIDRVFLHLTETWGYQITREAFDHHYENLVKKIYGQQVTLFDGALELLDSAQAAAIPVGLVTSTPRSWVKVAFDRFDLWSRFRSIVTRDDVSGRTKPDPYPYLKAVSELQVQSHLAFAVEDSAKGVMSARGAGMQVWGLHTDLNSEKDLSGAHGQGTWKELSIVKLDELVRSAL